jgi:hypothetical protein
MANENAPIARTSLDSTVIYTFFVFIAIFLGVFAFRVFTGEDCSKVGFVATSDSFRAGEVVSLRDTTFGAKEWEWNFGDGSAISKIKAPVHVFEKEGKYNIELLVNGKCEKKLTLTILPKKIVQVERAKLVLPVISVPKFIFSGEPASFFADSTNGVNFEWNFGETDRTDATGKQVQYTFASTGNKNITLYVDGKANVVTKQVKVIKRSGKQPSAEEVVAQKQEEAKKQEEVKKQEEAKAAAALKAPLISDDDFAELLNKVVKGKMQLSDVLEYACGKSTIPVTVNNADRLTLADFIQKLKENNRSIIKKVRLRTNANNCVLEIEVETKKKLF